MAVVGANYPNKRGPSRRFEIALCQPGEAVTLIPEPDNVADERAVAVFSARGIQIGYLTAERCGRISQMIRSGRIVTAVFQEGAPFGAVIRVAFDADEPVLPPKRFADPEPEWWPDEEYPDE